MEHNTISFYRLLNDMEDKEYIENYISYNIALISAGLKPSITINFNKKNNPRAFELWKCYGEKYLETLNLSNVILRKSEKSFIVLIYEKQLLWKIITKEFNWKFLNSIGYHENISLEGALETLVVRYNECKCPHELGVFLGYPIEDVKDFMECSEKECLTCGYWKVYNCVNKAKAIFNLFDNVKAVTVKNIIEGNRASELNYILKNTFKSNQELIL